MKRGQGAIEFTLITVAMLIIFASAFIVIEKRFKDVQEDRVDALVYELQDTIQAEIQIAYSAGSGYSRTFYVPRTLSGMPYAIELYVNQTNTSLDELIITTESKEYLSFLQFDVNGTIAPGYMNITGGTPVNLTPS